MDEANGILLIDKSRDWTSHDVVAKMRGLLHTRHIGHAGTLDPMATGLLIVLVGKACKASQYLMSQSKVYTGEVTFGFVTNSQDAEGEVMERRDIPATMTRESVAAAMKAMEGDQYQIPPMFSAIKINGQPLYKAARKGKEVEREKRFIHISKFELTDWTATAEKTAAGFCVECSKGTYVRTLAHDLGRNLGPGGFLSALRRVASGDFKIEDAVTIEELEAMSDAARLARLMPVSKFVPAVALI
ncbi:MAG: tRNA pseudouridine(55) synthase TruB [Opitutales bacterium]|nr:tRNA pseudouridine(55) synthase TruB [Opitutales bacterium]